MSHNLERVFGLFVYSTLLVTLVVVLLISAANAIVDRARAAFDYLKTGEERKFKKVFGIAKSCGDPEEADVKYRVRRVLMQQKQPLASINTQLRELGVPDSYYEQKEREGLLAEETAILRRLFWLHSLAGKFVRASDLEAIVEDLRMADLLSDPLLSTPKKRWWLLFVPRVSRKRLEG